MSPADHPAIGMLARVSARLYGGLVRLRNLYYDRPGAGWRSPLPVVSVGNLTVGGTGKTPFVSWLAQTLRSAGRKPAIVSRGYGGRAGKGPLHVSRGQGPLCPPAESGDEPYMLARYLSGVTIIAGSNRCAGARAAAEAGSDVVILDDGFQHRRLARDLDIVLLDADNPFGGDRLLPAGTLREPATALARADVVVITRAQPRQVLTPVEVRIRAYNRKALIFKSSHRKVGFFDPLGHAVASPERAVAFCGIGSPERFRADLEAGGVELVEFLRYRDHHPYTHDEIRTLQALAHERGVPLVTTEKDLVRLPEREDSPADPPLLALRIEANLFRPAPLLALVHSILDGVARQ